jgi:hypothetical protein
MNILQRRLVMQYCQFQTIFFDIDECKINHEELIRKLSLKPNLIYETFSYTETNRRYRLVYILYEPINTGFYKSVYLAFKEQIKDIVEDDKCAENPTQTIFGTNNNVYEINDFYYHINTSNLNSIYYGDVVLKQYTPSIVEENFYNYCTGRNLYLFYKQYSGGGSKYGNDKQKPSQRFVDNGKHSAEKQRQAKTTPGKNSIYSALFIHFRPPHFHRERTPLYLRHGNQGLCRSHPK